MVGTTLMEAVTWNPDMFGNIELGDKIQSLKEDIVNQIMIDNFSYLCAYEEPMFFTQTVKHFFRSHKVEFEKLYETTLLEYNPIENYDRHEESKDVYSDTITGGYTDTNSGTDTTENEISADNESGYQNDNKSTTTLGTSVTRNNNSRMGHDDKYTSHIHGNIGVTTSQQMIEAERRVVEFNILQYISEKFGHELMIRVS